MATSHCLRSSSRALRAVFKTHSPIEVTLPAFLIPALTTKPHTTHFSTTSRCRSKIGKMPLSLPPDVTFSVLEQRPKKGARSMSSAQPGSMVEITGPLGKMSLAIPPYMSISSDEGSSAKILNILDAEDRKQREMWGAFTTVTSGT